MTKIYEYVAKEKVNEEILCAFINKVSKIKKRRILRYKNKLAAIETLLGDILCRYALNDEFKLNGNLQFVVNEYGKPRLKDINGVYFNLSHSNGKIICAVDVMPVGIDIETYKNIDYMQIAKKFFTMEEYKILNKSKSYKKDDNFYKIWTARESYLKAIGTGLSKNFSDISVVFNHDEVYIIHRGKKVEYSIKNYYMDCNTIVSLAMKNKEYYRTSVSLKKLIEFSNNSIK